MKLRTRYTLLGFLVMAAVTTVLGSAMLLHLHTLSAEVHRATREGTEEALRHEIRQRAATLARMAARDVANHLYRLDMPAIRSVLQAFLGSEEVVAATVTDLAGRVVHDGTPGLDSYGARVLPPEAVESLRAGRRMVWVDPSAVSAVAPVTLGEEVIGGVRLDLSLGWVESAAREQQQAIAAIADREQERAASFLAALVLGAGLLVMAVAAAAAASTARPIERLARAAEAIGRGEYDASLPDPDGGDEIAVLARAFRDMRDNLRRSTVSRRYFDRILSSMADALFVVDDDGRIRTVNPAAAQLVAREPEDLVGRRLDEVIARPEKLLDNAEGSWGDDGRLARWLEAEAATAAGELVPVALSVARLPDEAGPRGWVVVAQDITERKNLEAELRLHATTDALTGIANRRSFTAQLERETARSRRYGHPLSLLLLDLDHFKWINDTFGHAVGDEVLRRFARCVAGFLRESDLFGRLGGEEFGILLPETDRDGALTLAERVRAAVEETVIPVGEDRVRVTVSIGIAEMPQPGISDDRLLSLADKALYAAKEAGRNRVATAANRPDQTADA